MKNNFKKIFATLTAVFLLTTMLLGCNNFSTITKQTEMGTIYFNKENAHYSSLLIFGTSLDYYVEDNFTEETNRTIFLNMANEIETSLKSIQNVIDIKDQNSECTKFNELEKNINFVASNTFIDLYYKSKTLLEKTVYFSPTLLNYSLLWKLSSINFDGTAPSTLPSSENLQKLNHVVDFSTISVDENIIKKTADMVTIDSVNYNTKIDFGAIAKGYALDIMNSIFIKYGFENGYINFGSSSINLLNHKNENWNLSIKNPRGEDNILKVTNINNTFVSTSGDYEMYYTKDNKRYSHIIDATNGKPYDNTILSATIIGKSGYFTDGISTCLCAMGIDNAIDFTKNTLQNEGYLVFIAVYDGEYKIYTNANTNIFTITNSQYKLVTF